MRVYQWDICVYKCDRCGKNFAFEERLETSLQKSKLCVFAINEKHLCDDCAKSFRRWFRDPEAKEADDAERRD